MFKTKKFSLLIIVVAMVMLMAACSGAVQDTEPAAGQNVAPSPAAIESEQGTVSFTGTVNAMDNDRWQVSGRMVNVDDDVTSGMTVEIGDTITVRANQDDDGSLRAITIERLDDDDANDNDDDDDDANDNDDDVNDNDDDNANDNDDNANDNDDDDDDANDNDDDDANDNDDDDANDNDDDDD